MVYEMPPQNCPLLHILYLIALLKLEGDRSVRILEAERYFFFFSSEDCLSMRVRKSIFSSRTLVLPLLTPLPLRSWKLSNLEVLQHDENHQKLCVIGNRVSPSSCWVFSFKHVFINPSSHSSISSTGLSNFLLLVFVLINISLYHYFAEILALE